MWKLFNLDEQYERYPEISRKEIIKFMQWIKAQPHMFELREQEALLFYCACDCSLEYSKRVLDNYLTCRTHVEELFGNLDMEGRAMQRAMKTISVCPMPKTTPEGNGVVVAKLYDTNTSNFNFADAIKLICLTMEFWLQEIGIIRGLIFVIDLNGVKLGHVARIAILQMKKFLYYLQEAIPVRVHGLHFINLVPFTDKILGLMTPFMKKELSSVLHLHNSMETFYQHVPTENLPKENGGCLMASKDLREIYYNKMRNSRKEILEFERTHCINEKLRPGKAKNASDLFGMEGNFKKLEID